MNPQLRRYTFKLYPNAAQTSALIEHARMCASLWNALLEMRETFYRRALQRGDKKTSLTAFDQGKDITALRAELAEWRAQPRGTQERVAEMLDLAFKAFFRRAREGAGASSGYPRFKSVMRADSVHLREPVKSCWTFTPSQGAGTAHFGPALTSNSSKEGGRRKSEPNGGSRGSPRARGEEGIYQAMQRGLAMSPRARGGMMGEKHTSWRLHMRGVPGAIKARGGFPVEPESFKTADIRYYDGAWWFSVCVAMPARREIGTRDLRVELDLIDKFASVTGANGELITGLSSPFSTEGKGEPNGARQEASRARGDEGYAFVLNQAPETASRAPADDGSERDRRFKRFSCRWRRENARIARMKAREARQRREALHRWTTKIARLARAVEIITPPKRALRTGRGNKAFPGAEVATIAALNRHVTAQAPASAVQMLEYKLAEAGAVCVTTAREDHKIGVGKDLRAAAISHRRAKRAVKQKEKRHV